MKLRSKALTAAGLHHTKYRPLPKPVSAQDTIVVIGLAVPSTALDLLHLVIGMDAVFGTWRIKNVPRRFEET